MVCSGGLVNMSSEAFNIDFYLGTKQDLINYILEPDRQSFEYIVTPNINHIVMLSKSSQLSNAYGLAKLKVLDSKILEIILNIFGVKPAEVIPGSTLTEELFTIANELNLEITVVGSQEDEIKRVQSIYKNIKINHYNPPMGFIENYNEVKKCIDFVNQNNSSIVFFAVGCPRQELLASLVKQQGRAKGIGLCIGASINFLTGKVKRAPQIFQTLKLEWLFRLSQEPKRLASRYFYDFFYMIKLVFEEIRRKRN